MGIPEKLELLPYHDYGVGKYSGLGKKSETENVRAPGTETMKRLETMLRDMGLPVAAPGNFL